TILAMEGIESDKLVGLETIPILIGKPASLKLLYTINILLVLVLIAAAVSGLMPHT
ncbi:unnamed protein product, partial [marine sediment metagenome]